MKNHDLLAGKLLAWYRYLPAQLLSNCQIVKAVWAGLKKALTLRMSARFAGIFFGCVLLPA
ncbi:hypothetical protein [Comamonas testosteroni]|uniref:hypothetical protein n=1 Tax=Comamonas testosteroni TaxID=285 RepID=UPI001EE74AB9|nr:hypothetical protein [Comamonas testosteroni]